MPLPWLVHRHDSFILCCYGLFGVVGTKSEKLYKEYCDPLFFETLKDVKSAKSKRGFGVFLLLCQYVFCLCSLNGDLWYALEILSEVADQRSLLCSVFSDSPLYLSTANSLCVNVSVCVCVSLPACGWGFECVGICARERQERGIVISPVCVAGTDCLHLCKYTLTCSFACNGQ